MAISLIVVIVFANGAATVLYSGEGSIDPLIKKGDRTRHPILQRLAEIQTLPIPSQGITDVRDVALITSLGLALLVVAAAYASGADNRATHNCGTGVSPVNPQERRLSHACSGICSKAATVFPSTAEAWLFHSTLCVICLALLSIIANDTFDLSWGWIVRFVACAGWALMIARTFTPIMVRHTLFALLVLALVCMVLTIIDRADRDLAHFQWPIGPITITAALAAVWAASAGTWAVGQTFFRRLQPAWRVLALAVACVVGVYVLQQTGRRAPVLGLIAAVLVAGSLLIWSRYRSRLLMTGVMGLLAISFSCAVFYVIIQLRSPVREASGPLALRLAYWKLSGRLIVDHPWLGSGPDTFMIGMTNRIAPLRAESPHFFHGNFDLYAHNEWIQAAVELGLPAALVYFALPLGVIFYAIRHLRHGAAPQTHDRAHSRGNNNHRATCAMIVALIAGLLAVVITECASITLRVPMMPVWYWTLLGLLASLCRVTPQSETATRSQLIPPRATSACLVLLAVACFVVSTVELNRSVARADEQRGRDGHFASRLYADKTISDRYRAATLASREIRPDSQAKAIKTATSIWRDLYDTIPSLHDVPAMYADVLNLSGQPEKARAVLEDALSDRLNPYNVASNVVYARLLADDPVEQLRCVQRALRSGALDATLQALLDDVLVHATAVDVLNRDLPSARAVAEGRSDGSHSLPTVELLRINAYRQECLGRLNVAPLTVAPLTVAPASHRCVHMDEAIADQRLAANFYRRLEQEHSQYRRTDRAELDAFFVLARLLYKADHANYPEAYDAIVEAERYAILGIGHEAVGNPQPERGFLGGEVIPTELPSRLRPLWQLSALLHLVVGNEYYLDGRIYSSLPPSQWTPTELNRQLARLARQAYEDLSGIPPTKRPRHYDALLETAQRYEQLSPGG